MAKTRMNNAHRDVLRNFCELKMEEVVDRKQEKKLYTKLLEESSKAIRKKYPEDDMIVLRRYNFTSHDNYIKVVFDGGRVDGQCFETEALPDRPYERAYSNRNDIYTMGKSFENLLDEYAKIKAANEETKRDKLRDCNTLITFAKYVEDVLEVIKVPKDIEYKLVAKSTALVALSPDVIQRLQRDFMS